MNQYTGPLLVQTMVCRLFGVKPLSENVFDYYQKANWEHISVNFTSKYNNFYSW